MAVPRPRKSAVFDADDQTIVEHFDRAMRLKATQRGVSSEITALNAQMSEAGVDPGTLTICCKLARMPRGKRGVAVALLHRYLQVLARQLDGPTVPVEHAARPNGGLTPEPFAGREGVGAPSPTRPTNPNACSASTAKICSSNRSRAGSSAARAAKGPGARTASPTRPAAMTVGSSRRCTRAAARSSSRACDAARGAYSSSAAARWRARAAELWAARP
jgi:hypothetical protein